MDIFNKDYTYNIYQVDFPVLNDKLEDTFILSNDDAIPEIRFFVAFGKIYSLIGQEKSRIENPEWIQDILVCKLDLSLYFDDMESSVKEYIIKRIPYES